MPVHAWRGSEFDRAAFSVLFGRSRFKPAKVATKRAGRMGSQRGAHGAGWADPVENASAILLFSKPFCARLRAGACESAALGCLPSRWEGITGSAPRSRRRAIVERAQCVVRRMPGGRFAQCHAFFLLFFFRQARMEPTSTLGWRPWVLSLPGAMLNSMGGGARIDKNARFCGRVARALILAPSSPAKARGGLMRLRPEPIMAPQRSCSLRRPP